MEPGEIHPGERPAQAMIGRVVYLKWGSPPLTVTRATWNDTDRDWLFWCTWTAPGDAAQDDKFMRLKLTTEAPPAPVFDLLAIDLGKQVAREIERPTSTPPAPADTTASDPQAIDPKDPARNF